VNRAWPDGPDRPRVALPAVGSSSVADLVRGTARPATVLACFPRAMYLGHDGGVLVIEASDGVHLPNGVVVARHSSQRPLAAARSATRGRIGDGRVVVGDLEVQVRRWRRTRPVLRTATTGTLRRSAEEAAAALARSAPPLPAALQEARQRLVTALGASASADALHIARRELLGRGAGSTPSGDDVLAGLLAGTTLLAEVVVGSDEVVVGSDEVVVGSDEVVFGSDEVVVGADEVVAVAAGARDLGVGVAALAPDATTAISASLLVHASRGEVVAPAAQLLSTLTGRGAVEPAVARLVAVGSSSGRDLAAGLLAAANLVLAACTSSSERNR
jgi:hypothetical protein